MSELTVVEKRRNQSTPESVNEKSRHTQDLSKKTPPGMPLFLHSRSKNKDEYNDKKKNDENLPFQPKLTIGKPGDTYEQEADRVADQVVKMPLPSEQTVQRKAVQPSITRMVQRQEENEETVQTKPAIQSKGDGNLEKIQSSPDVQLKKTASDSHNATTNQELSINASRGSGSPLPPNTRNYFESRMGADFSGVRIHNDSNASSLSQGLNAQAFTVGNDIYFNQDKYDSTSSNGKKLLAHELVHVVQQRSVPQAKTQESEPFQQSVNNIEEKVPLEDRTENQNNRLTNKGSPVNNETISSTFSGNDVQSLVSGNVTNQTNPAIETPNEETIQENTGSLIKSGSDDATEEVTPVGHDNEISITNATTLTSFVSNGSADLENEASEAARGNSDDKNQAAGPANGPVIQRSIWSGITNVVGQGADWINQHIIGPISNLASAGWNVISGMGEQLKTAYDQLKANGLDILNVPFSLFRVMRDHRRKLSDEAIAQQERDQVRAVAEGRLSPEQAAEPTLLEKADAVAHQMEGAAESDFEVKNEIIEGAILGDFKENPSIWNTIGQIAIGFVPYAGQVADVRDLIATIIKLHKKGWKDPWEWFNLVLTVIGLIPGVGDVIKGAFSATAPYLIKRGVRWVLGKAGRLWSRISQRIPGLLRGARQVGRRLLQGARNLGSRLLQGVRNLGRRTVETIRGAAQGVRRIIGQVGDTARRLASGIAERARTILSGARNLVGRIAGAISGAVRRAVDSAGRVASRGAELVRRMMERGRRMADTLRRKISEGTRRATEFLRSSVRGAIERGKALLRSAKERGARLLRTAITRGRQLATQAYNGARNLIRNGIRWVKEKAIRWVREKLRSLKHRVLNYLREKWQRLKEKLGIESSGKKAAAKGLAREEKVADIVGGRVSREKVVARGLGSTDIDVIGRSGELIAVGGPAKAKDLSRLGRQMQILKAVADERGVKAIAYFTHDTPEAVLQIARRWLGSENVHLFTM